MDERRFCLETSLSCGEGMDVEYRFRKSRQVQSPKDDAVSDGHAEIVRDSGSLINCPEAKSDTDNLSLQAPCLSPLDISPVLLLRK